MSTHDAQLKYLYNTLLNTYYNVYTENEELESWMDSVVILEEFYAGLLSSSLHPNKAIEKSIFEVSKYKDQLQKIKNISEKDLSAYENCTKFIDTIIEADQLLRTIGVLKE